MRGAEMRVIRYSAREMSRSTGWLPVAGFCFLLALFAVRLGDSAVRNSFTVDEPNYLGIGLYLWESDDYDFAATLSLHPPLTFHIASLPLLAFDLDDLPRERGIVRRLLEREEPGWRALRIAGRVPFILLACWGAAICFLWARAVAGDAAGLLATFLYTFSPTLLANGGLMHSDITVTVFFLQTPPRVDHHADHGFKAAHSVPDKVRGCRVANFKHQFARILDNGCFIKLRSLVSGVEHDLPEVFQVGIAQFESNFHGHDFLRAGFGLVIKNYIAPPHSLLFVVDHAERVLTMNSAGMRRR